MSVIVMAEYQAAVERAQSRAAVLQSLQDSYGTKASSGDVKVVVGKQKGSKVVTSSSASAPDAALTSDKGVVNDVVECLLTAIGDHTMRTRQFFKDSIRGKAIVVENLKAQLEASKASKKLERASKRKRTLSNKTMKRLKIGETHVLPGRPEVMALHDLWWEHAINIVAGASSEAQLQAK
jgi:hypothetical protein